MMKMKDSFVFHADWLDVIEDLPEEQQLEVYRAITHYAIRGEVSKDPFARAVTALIRKFIDSDRAKYEKSVQQRKDAVRKRWNKQKESDSEAYDRIDSDANDTVTVTDTDTDTDTVTDTVTGQKEIKKIISSATADNKSRKGATAAAAAADGFGLEDRIAELKKRPKWIEQLAKRFKISQAEIIRRLDEFRDDMELRGKVVNNPQSLFVTWLGDLKKSAKPDEPSEPNFGPGEYRNAKGERTYARGEVIVPEDAPPRPAKGYWWSRPSNAWCNLF